MASLLMKNPMNVTNLKLRELIVAVRTCKTSAEERGTIQRECAQIRESFAGGKESHRMRNMLKLMYISMLGYSTEFAQMEVVKMLALPDYGDKRIGYLTLTVLLDETTEVLTLAENVIKKDLTDKQAFTQALALATVANVAGEDMARDVMNDIANLVSYSNKNTQKKACLAALRIVRRVPEFAEIYLDKMTDILQEHHQGALVSGLSLVNECLAIEHGGQFLEVFRRQVPQAIRLLKSLVLCATQHDSDVQGIANPFLQVRLLQFFRVVAKDCPTTSEAVNDILAQVATNTESSKSVGFTILYECAKTIFAIHADEGLKVLGINILARFLSSAKDNNLRYVALSTLLQVYKRDPEAVKRHQATIIDCLKDVDLSIRRRALELTVALIDEENVRSLAPDLLAYLSVCGEEMKEMVTHRVCEVVEEQAPTPEWRVEMSLRVFKAARSSVTESFATSFIAHVTNQSSEVKVQAAQSLWEELSAPMDSSLNARTAMVLAAVWCVGEYGDLLVKNNGGSVSFAEQVVSTVFAAMNNTTSTTVKQYSLTSLAKLVCKFPQTSSIATTAFEMQSTNLDCELQQRACEYTALVESFGELAAFSLAPIPPIVPVEEEAPVLQTLPTAAKEVATPTIAPPQPPKNIFDDLFAGGGPSTSSPSAAPPAATRAPDNDALFGGPAPTQPVAPPVPAASTAKHDDLFGGPSPQASSSTAMGTQPQNGGGRHDDLFGPSTNFVSAPPPVPSGPKKTEVHRCGDFAMTVSLLKTLAPGDFTRSDIQAEVSSCGGTLTDFQFLVAVPRTTVVDVKPLVTTTVTPSQPLQQILHLDSRADPNGGKNLLLKIRLVYKLNGAEKIEQFQVSKEMSTL